jgi:aspartyl-tRNA(Asn)/glutamyl-tRNA(Gln) amidotransferase subunit C
MTISRDDVHKVAQLASLHVEESELPRYQKNLQEILDLAKQMETVDTESIEPIAHCFEIAQRLRRDCVTETNQRDTLQALTPHVESGLYSVPPVIE